MVVHSPTNLTTVITVKSLLQQYLTPPTSDSVKVIVWRIQLVPQCFLDLLFGLEEITPQLLWQKLGAKIMLDATEREHMLLLN